MDAVQELLEEIQRMQCLVILSQAEEQPMPTSGLLQALQIEPDRLSRLVTQLAADGLLEVRSAPTHPLPCSAALTARARSLLVCWDRRLSATDGVPRAEPHPVS